MADERLTPYREARKAIERTRAVRIFYSHLAAYILGNIFLGSWNALTYFVKDNDTLWFFLPLLFWGVGVIVHYVFALALFEEWWENDERTIDERVRG